MAIDDVRPDTGILVHPINTQGLGPLWNDGLRYALAYDGRENVYVISDEGVGWVYLGGEGLTWMSNVSLTELENRAAENETVDLAKWVRVFGDRLDTNVAIWVRKLTDARPDWDPCQGTDD